MKGLSIRKTNVPKILRQRMTEILQKNILESKEINLTEVLSEYDKLEVLIEESLKNGNTEFLLPKNLELISSYKTPDTIEPVRAAIIWNALEKESEIVPPERINMIKLDKALSDCMAAIPSLEWIDNPTPDILSQMTPQVVELIQKYPDKAKAIASTVFNIGVQGQKIDISRFGLSCMAVPKSVNSLPEYIRPFIDYENMINTNMTNGYLILESLGIYCEDVLTTKYKTNIISI